MVTTSISLELLAGTFAPIYYDSSYLFSSYGKYRKEKPLVAASGLVFSAFEHFQAVIPLGLGGRPCAVASQYSRKTDGSLFFADEFGLLAG